MSERKTQILQALASMLEQTPLNAITTSKLAKTVGVSEAALYRHFPSKKNMFEQLIAFTEEALFSRIHAITKRENRDTLEQCQDILTLVLTFAEKNPGLSKLLIGDALAYESCELHQRINQLYNRLETEFRQLLRNAEFTEGQRPVLLMNDAINLLQVLIEGKISQFVRSNFKQSPTQGLHQQWQHLRHNFFKPAVS